MGMWSQRWLVLYRTDEGPASKIVDDKEYAFPFGVEATAVAEDCIAVVAIVALPDDYKPHVVLLDQCEIEVQLPKEEE